MAPIFNNTNNIPVFAFSDRFANSELFQNEENDELEMIPQSNKPKHSIVMLLAMIQ